MPAVWVPSWASHGQLRSVSTSAEMQQYRGSLAPGEDPDAQAPPWTLAWEVWV